MNIRSSLALFACAAFLFAASAARSGSATWNLNPTNGDWNTAANWTPATVPNGATDLATFGVSNTTSIGLSAGVRVDSIIFNPGASAYSFTLATGSSDTALNISGAGIVNNSDATQTFNLPRESLSAPVGNVVFTGTANAGAMTVYSNGEGRNELEPSERFKDSSSADHATFINDGPPDGLTPYTAGMVTFDDTSTAASATIINNAGTHIGGETLFEGRSTAGNATIVCNAGTAPQNEGGYVQLTGDATCGDGTFIINGSDVSQQGGGHFELLNGATTGSATLIANGGQVDGGLIQIDPGAHQGGNARIELFGNGQFDMSGSDKFSITAGSLEGDGLVFLGNQTLVIGGNSLSTSFAGAIADGGIYGGVGGSLVKTGSGRLTLSGTSTYTGGTQVNQGSLIVSNRTGSAAGAGAVNVNVGTLGGSGIISGAVTVGTGGGAGAFLAPAAGSNKQATLTIGSTLTFNADAIYTYTFKAKKNKARTDLVIANGITINGASFNLSGQIQNSLRQGLVLIVINNTGANPINGVFSNLPDGAIVNMNGNNLQASYEGGDGNDLTLTVVQ